MGTDAENNFIVYLLTCIPTGQCYVGITLLRLPQRWRQHVALARRKGRDGALQQAIRKHGEGAFELAEIRSVQGLEAACLAEREEISRLGTMWPGGLNMNEGGGVRAGFRHSEETIRKMKAAAVGRVLSAETKAKLAAAAKRQWNDEELRARLMDGRETPVAKVAQRESGRRLFREYGGFPKGGAHSPETRKKIGEAGKGRVAWNKGKPMLPHVQAALLAAHTGKPGHRRGALHTEEALVKMSRSQAQAWARRKATHTIVEAP